EPTGAVAELLGLRSHTVEDAQPQVRNRRVLGELQMPTRGDRAAAFAEQERREVVVVVAVAVAVGRAISDHAVVEQRARAFLDGLQFAEEVRQRLDVVTVDLLDPLELLGLATVVRQFVVPLADADLSVSTVAALIRES